MKSVVEAFARNTSCSDLSIHYDSAIVSKSPMSYMLMLKVARYSEYYAVLLITFCRCVQKISFLEFFQSYYSYPLFACSLRYNTNVQHLDLSKNAVPLCDEALANIAQALSINATVKVVEFGDWISREKLAVFLTHYAFQLTTTSGLERIFVDTKAIPGEMENQIIRRIKRMRVFSGRSFQVVIR